MSKEHGNYVFLMVCNDFTEAKVIKSYLESLNLNPRIKDENTRGIAPHFENLLGKLVVEIPEYQFMDASLALEEKEKPTLKVSNDETQLQETQSLAKKSLLNAILGCVFIPVICNFISMSMGYRVLKNEKPLSAISRNRLLWAILFNSIAFFAWLTYGPQILKKFGL